MLPFRQISHEVFVACGPRCRRVDGRAQCVWIDRECDQVRDMFNMDP
jgi:hypothetical protein